MARLFALTFFAIFVMVIMALGSGALVGAAGDGDAQIAAQQSAMQRNQNAFMANERTTLLINRDDTGQFRLTAQVNGQDTSFLIDTGADVVAISVGEAERIGLPVNPGAFEPIMQTASGTGYGAIYEVDELIVAGKEFHNIEVVVLDGLETNLLGQTVLSRLGKVELRGNQMVIGG